MAQLSWVEVRLCEELCLGVLRTLSPAPRRFFSAPALPPVITAGKCLGGK